MNVNPLERNIYESLCSYTPLRLSLPYGLAVRIPGFHPGGPGSTPGMGTSKFILQGKVFSSFKLVGWIFTFLGGEKRHYGFIA